MRGPNSTEDRLLADICSTLLILIPVAIFILAFCCQPECKRVMKSLWKRRRGPVPEINVVGDPGRRGLVPEINVDGDPALVLLSSGRVVVLDRPRRPIPVIPLPGDFTSLDIHELEAGHILLGPGDSSSQGSKDNLQSPIQDYLPPPSYESIFGHPLPEPPSYTDAITSVAFPNTNVHSVAANVNFPGVHEGNSRNDNFHGGVMGTSSNATSPMGNVSFPLPESAV